MTMDEVTRPDPLKAQLERTKKAERALKVKKAALKAQQAQDRLRDARSDIK